MNKISNLIKFYNRKPKEIIKDLRNGYSDYPSSFRQMLKKHGNENITAISIVRTPLSNMLYQILNTITFSELDKRLQSDLYDSETDDTNFNGISKRTLYDSIYAQFYLNQTKIFLTIRNTVDC